MTATLSQADARTWIDRWDAQQQSFLPDREERFTALIDAVQECAGRADPLVLDLGCGPGSLATRLLRRIPEATVVAIDADPLLLALGRAASNGLTGSGGAAGALRFEDLDLRVPGWTAALGLHRQADAAVSTTALHWLPPDALAAMYAEVATVLRPGGLMLNGDHLTEDKAAAPTLARLGRALNEREEQRRDSIAETWEAWWGAVTADPALRPRSPSVRGERMAASTTARPPGCSAFTSTRCAPRDSPRSAPSGSTATTACSAGCSATDARCDAVQQPGACEIHRYLI